MSTRGKFWKGIYSFFESTNQETIKPLAPFLLDEDFLGTLNGDLWTAIDTGDETEAKVADQHGGIFELLFTTKDEKQTPGIACNDVLEVALDNGPIFEARVAIQTLPTLLCEFFFGLAGAHADGTVSTGDGPSVHAFFIVDGSGEVFVRTDDGTLESSIVTTGVTVVAGEYHIYKIDMTDPENILFAIDGKWVALGTTFDMSTGSGIMLQPYFRGHKASDVADVYVDDDGSSHASWAGTACTITDGGANLLITATDAGGTQTAIYTLAGLTPGQLYKVTLVIADGTGAWGAGDSLTVTTNAGVAIETQSLAAGAGTYALNWVAAGATDKIKIIGTIANLATLNITSIAAGTGAEGALRIDNVRVWNSR
jgi:hypothetical protein